MNQLWKKIEFKVAMCIMKYDLNLTPINLLGEYANT
jgi:hypothetical protein